MKRITVLMILMVALMLNVNAQSEVAKREFNNTLKAYFEAKNAFAKDDGIKAKQQIKALVEVIDNFPVKTLNAEQSALWKAETETIKKSAVAITEQEQLKDQRNSFWAVSTAMIKLAQAYQLNKETIYVQYCPMAKKSWLNEVEAIQNPFYGSKMYACGDVTATIAKK